MCTHILRKISIFINIFLLSILSIAFSLAQQPTESSPKIKKDSLNKVDNKNINVRLDTKNNDWSKWHKIIDPTAVSTNMSVYLPINNTNKNDLIVYDYATGEKWHNNLTWSSGYTDYVNLINVSGILYLNFTPPGNCCGMPLLLNASKSALPRTDQGYSISFLFNKRKSGSFDFIHDNGAGTNPLEIGGNNAGNLSIALCGSGAQTGIQLGNNTFAHLCMSWNPSTNRFVVRRNGTIVNNFSLSCTSNFTSGGFKIGHNDYNTGVFNGTLKNLRIWNGYELSTTECSDVFNADTNTTAGSSSSPSTNTTIQSLGYDKNGNLKINLHHSSLPYK